MSEATAVMFHHFHGGSHRQSPGSIDDHTLDELISEIEREFNILGAEEFRQKVESRSLSANDTCLTFDDALKSQVDVAVPVLESRGITAQFFVYSTAFEPGGAELEIVRDFRSQKFESTEIFLIALLDSLEALHGDIRQSLQNQFPPNYLAQYSFYSLADRQLRFLRDEMLTADQYSSAMRRLMDDAGVDQEEVRQRLMMNLDDLRLLSQNGHEIGLHSRSHPTRIDEYDTTQVADEYESNFSFITNVTGKRPRTMSHPCGRFSGQSLETLRNLGISVGFIDSPAPNVNNDPLCIPRHDHSDLVRLLLT